MKDFLSGVQIARVRGIEVQVHWSLFVIFALVAVGLAQGLFIATHPDLALVASWGLGLAGAFLFFGSILLHELAHAIVGNRCGIPIRRITLFIFGGVSHMERQPPSSKAEFLMASVGPLTSVLLGVLGLGIAVIAPAPFSTLFAWLGGINVLLAVFNMVPGFPLDGGRVLRALLWRVTGNMRSATKWASGVGQLFSWLLIGTGALILFGGHVAFLGGGAMQGIWLIVIGWFLNQAAGASYQQLVIHEELHSIPAARLMRSRLLVVSPHLRVDELIDDYIMASEQRHFPVVEGQRLVGVVAPANVRRIPRSAWTSTTVGAIMTPQASIATVPPDAAGDEVLEQLSRNDAGEIPVVSDGRLLGVVGAQEIQKWLSLRGPALASLSNS